MGLTDKSKQKLHLAEIGGSVHHMEILTIEVANAEYKSEMQRLKEEYGDWSLIPKEMQHFLGEKVRLMACIAINPNWKIEEVVSHYSVDRRVAQQLFGIEEDTMLSRRTKRSDKYDALNKWLADNVYAEVTPQELADVGELSYQTVLKFIADNPNTFRKLQRGKYEVRDEKADRQAEK